MQINNLLKQIDFIKEIDKIKYIQRKTKLFNSNRCENDAEHSWHLAMMALVLAEHSDKPIDILKVLKMVLIHDIVEIDAGDTFIYDTQKNHTNTEQELMAAKRIFGLLPEEQAKEFIEIWKEFEEGHTDEAKFAKSMDRFEPLLQNASNNGGTWTEFNVDYQKVYDKKKAIKEGSAAIWNYAENLLNESVEKGVLKKLQLNIRLMNFQKIFNFLAQLQVYNDRNWFNEHKAEYDEARATFETLINALILPLSQLDPSIGTVTAGECIFRIYRDIRFSNDKTPYKTHFSAFIANGGRKTRMAGYYIHIQPDESFLAGGIYAPDSTTLESIRNAIYHNPDEIRRILDDKKFRKFFPEISNEEKLKNPPKGYPKEFKEIELIKNKHFVTQQALDNDFFMKENVVDRLMEIFKVQYPFNEFLNKAVK